MGCLVGIDFGTKRTGLAYTDPNKMIATGLKNLPTSEASTINYMQVLFGSLWGILFFSEIININFLIGSLLVLLGTIISTTKKIKKT